MEKSEVDEENEMSIPKTIIKTDSLQTESSTMKDFDENIIRGKNKELIQETKNMAITYQNAASTNRSLHSTPSRKFTVDVGTLLPCFSGYDFDVHTWIKRVDAVQMAYNIPYNVMTVVVAGKLQGLAYVWFHSEVEHVSMPWNILKMKLINVFFHTSLNQEVMKRFLYRKWWKKEKFMKYFFSKITLGSKVGINETSMIQYLIDGFDCPTLQDYSRNKNYNSLQELFVEMQDLKKPNGEKVENRIFRNMIERIISPSFYEDQFKKDNENDKNDNIKLEAPIQIYRSAASFNVNYDFGALLPYFNNQIYDVHEWMRHVDAVQMAYNIPDNVMTVIAAAKLQEFAQIWFYSKVEHNYTPWSILKMELINMFSKESNKKRLMNQFLDRKWVAREAFTKYYVDKFTLGTGIGINEPNMIRYVIDGIDNAALQNSTKLKNYNSLFELFNELRDLKKTKNQVVPRIVPRLDQPYLKEEIIKDTQTSILRLEYKNTTVNDKTESAGITPLPYKENSEFAEDFTFSPVLSDSMPTEKIETSEQTCEVSTGLSSVVQVKNNGQQIIKNDKFCDAEELCRNVQRILNIVTPETMYKYLIQIRNLKIYTIQQMEAVIDLIYESAVNVPSYSTICAHLSRELARIQVSVYTTKGDLEVLDFRKLLARKCRLEFEKNIDKIERNHKLQEIEACTDPVKKKELQLFLDNYDVRVRMRSVGNVLFIGELFKVQILAANTIIRCLHGLLGMKNDKNLECLCTLLKVTGKVLESKNVELSKIFEELNNIRTNTDISTRVRFVIQGVITLQCCNWIPRMQIPNL